MNEFLTNTNLVVEDNLTPERLISIKNAVMQLEKETIRLGMTITREGIKNE